MFLFAWDVERCSTYLLTRWKSVMNENTCYSRTLSLHIHTRVRECVFRVADRRWHMQLASPTVCCPRRLIVMDQNTRELIHCFLPFSREPCIHQRYRPKLWSGSPMLSLRFFSKDGTQKNCRCWDTRYFLNWHTHRRETIWRVFTEYSHEAI